MGIFSKGLSKWDEVQIVIREKSEAKLLLTILVNLKNALKSTNKTLKVLDGFMAKIARSSSFSDDLNIKMIELYVRVKNDISLNCCFPNDHFLKALQEKIEARKLPASYRSMAYSGKDNFLINLIKKLSERNSSMGEVLREDYTRKYLTQREQFSECELVIRRFSRIKQTIEESIRDLESYFASIK